MSKPFDTYQSVLDYLYTQLPMFQRIGAAAYKKDLSNTIKLCEQLDNPQRNFRSVHVAGTNGKGSCSHFIASILQEAGLKVGLYTSPHLKSFTERIKINGEEMPEKAVMNFVNHHHALINKLKPSFFEITVAMAFEHFSKEKVDFAVIEVGMGGRLDSTNIILPEVALITNISKDHEQWLGNTLAKIAGEKAGIIKPDVPVVIGEKQQETSDIFRKVAEENQSPLVFAEEVYHCEISEKLKVFKEGNQLFSIKAPTLAGYQSQNLQAVLAVIDQLRQRGLSITSEHLQNGIHNMVRNTGLKGRWQLIQESPKIICDVGHNEAGVRFIVQQLQKETYDNLHIVWGTVNDKDIKSILHMLPKKAQYYFCQANIPRALAAHELKEQAAASGLQGEAYSSVAEAIDTAVGQASKKDLIFVGGSTFVVAEIDGL
ncbi:MAG: folylpolyglutamate synthase/dihydrofolate synthase family protein [Fulvivirga sp.]|nr:folylpolyglutamate synthase/dihydrofolate synthase family protein [Fulvivirga sp.]